MKYKKYKLVNTYKLGFSMSETIQELVLKGVDISYKELMVIRLAQWKTSEMLRWFKYWKECWCEG